MGVIVGSPYYAAVDELFSGRTGTAWDATGPRTYLRRFLVQVKLKEMSEIAVCYAPGIPLPYSFYVSSGPSGGEYDLASLAVRFSARQHTDDDWQFWVVEVEYSTEMPPGGMPDPINQGTGGGAGGGGDDEGAANNPELEAPELEWDTEVTQVVLQRDLFDEPLVNSAKQPFIPPPTVDVAYPVLVMTRNELSWSREDASKWSFAVNSLPFLGAPAGRAQSLPPKAKRVWRGNLVYWRITYRIRFQVRLQDGTLRSWNPQFLDQGLCRLQDDDTKPNFNKPIPIMRGANPITQPDLLDGTGQPVKADVDGYRAPHYLSFVTYHDVDFTDLLVNGM